MEAVFKFFFSTLLVSWPKPNTFLKVERRVSTSIFTNPVLPKESLSFPVSLPLRMLTNSLQLDPLQQSWLQSNLWILSQVKQPSPASYMLLKTVMISRAHKQAAAPVQTGTSLPTCPTSTYSDNLQRSLLLYLPQGKFTPVGGDIVDCHIYLHTSSSYVFLACRLCGGSGSVSQKRDT